MKKSVFYLIAISIISCNQPTKTIEGNMSNTSEETTLYLEELFPELNPVFVDSCKVKNGKFSFSVDEQSIGIYKLYHKPNNFAILILKNGDKINLDMDLDNLSLYYGNGSNEIEGYVKILNIIYDTKIKEDSLKLVYQKAEGTPEQQIIKERIMVKYNEIMLYQNSKIENFIINNSDNFASVLALINLGSIDEYYDLYKSTSDTLDKYYLENNWISNIKEDLKAKETTSIGAIAPNFTINDTNGKPVSLTNFRGKYVLIDFWASWCKPCRDANPNLVRLYQQYKPKGLEIIGISLDDTTRTINERNNWLNAIESDNINWIQVSDLIGAESEAAKLYGVKSIPSTFLLNKEGKIIAKDLNGTLLNQKLSEIFE
jgi:thiol-disulfide isomerase/thioredoxin